jgi:hypothetical protein
VVWLHLRFTALLVGVATASVALGYAPTLKRGGTAGILAMWMAVGVNVLASSIAALPITIARLRPQRERLVTVFMGSLALRMALVVVLATGVALVGEPAERPFLLWVAVSYLALLPVDTLYAQRHARTF